MKKVVVIEDDKILSKALTEELIDAGVEVFLASDGAEGLKLILEKKPDLVLLDLLMPIMDGVEMLKKLREDEWGKEALVVILTNIKDQEMIAKSMVTSEGSNSPFEYWVKSDLSISDVAEKVKGKLA